MEHTVRALDARVKGLRADIRWLEAISTEEAHPASARVNARVKLSALRGELYSLLSNQASDEDALDRLERLALEAAQSGSFVAASRLISEAEVIRVRREEEARARRAEWGEDLSDEQLLELMVETIGSWPLPMRKRLVDAINPVRQTG